MGMHAGMGGLAHCAFHYAEYGGGGRRGMADKNGDEFVGLLLTYYQHSHINPDVWCCLFTFANTLSKNQQVQVEAASLLE